MRIEGNEKGIVLLKRAFVVLYLSRQYAWQVWLRLHYIHTTVRHATIAIIKETGIE